MDFDLIVNGDGATNPGTTAVETDPFLSAYAGDAQLYKDEDAASPEPEADQQKKTEESGKPEEIKKDYTIKYKGKEEVLHLSGEELTVMLQKGYNYDAVLKERDALKGGENAQRILKAIAEENGMTVEEYIEAYDTATSEEAEIERIRSEYGDMPDAAAKEILAARNAERAKNAEAKAAAALNADIEAAKEEYPNFDINALDEEVEQLIEGGMKPLEAMRLHELHQLRAEKTRLNAKVAAYEKNQDNRSRSTGRAESKPSVAADPFLRGYMGGG